jgi:hypothetical protein
MKNLFLFFLAILASITVFAQSNSFHDDSRNFDIKLDMGGYNGTIKDNLTDSTRTSGAAAVVLTPQMAWAMSDAISLGGGISYSHYLDSSASSSKAPLLQGLDVNFLFDIHFVRTPRTDMMIGLKLGVAGIRLNPYDGTGDIYGSMGAAGDFHLMARFYVTNKLAIVASLGTPSYVFNKFGKNLNDTYTLRFRGVYFGTGITFKLPNQKTSGSQRG